MNAKKAKILRAYVPEYRDARYVTKFHAKTFAVLKTGSRGLAVPRLVKLTLSQTRLVPDCGRAKYRAAKRAVAA